MKIFSTPQIKAWDAYTIEHEPVSSAALMERAARACVNWILRHFDKSRSLKIFCGTGNNGGDGLAITRILIENGYDASAFIVASKKAGSPDFEINLERLYKISNEIYLIEEEEIFPALSNDIVIDALFGTGLNKKITGRYARLIKHINNLSETVISIDVPSGLFVDESSKIVNLRPDGLHLTGKSSTQSGPDDQAGFGPIIKATYTLTFQNQKLAFLMPENGPYTGKVILLDIQLSKEYEEKETVRFE
ncbi:MAG: NAD(P)H-hydrate epimerase, partial [Bacteroidota bacterium]|nr:NAD(P)H-hydrate epimerase [Bacteroidota bacterium]